MALSYKIESNSYGGRYMYATLTQTKNIATNKSTIDWTLTVTGGSAGYYSTGPTTLKIAGKEVYYCKRLEWDTLKFPTGKGSVSGSIEVEHESDGSCSVNVSLTTAIYTATTTTKSGTWVLDDIPRAAELLTASNFNDEENPKITYSNPAGSAVDSLQIGIYSADNTTAYVAYKSISKTESSFTFSLTDAERKVLRKAAVENTLAVNFRLKTVIGGVSQPIDVLERTLTIKNPNPVLNPTIVDTNVLTKALTDGTGDVLVKYCSNAEFAVNATAQKESTIISQSVTCGSKNSTNSTGTLNNIESDTFVFTATDSRDNTTSKTVTVPFIDYVKLTCNISNNKPDADGDMTVECSGNYFNGSFGNVDNTLTVQYRYKIQNGDYSDWTNMTVVIDNNRYVATSLLSGLDYQKTYVFQTRAIDQIYTAGVDSIEYVAKTTPVFDWGEKDFNVNGELRVNKKPIGAGICNYTTTEQLVGTFLDKKLYGKMYVITVPNQSTRVDTPLNIDNVDLAWVDERSFIHTTSGATKSLNTYESSSAYVRAAISGGNIRINPTASEYYSGTAYVIVNYTKNE